MHEEARPTYNCKFTAVCILSIVEHVFESSHAFATVKSFCVDPPERCIAGNLGFGQIFVEHRRNSPSRTPSRCYEYFPEKSHPGVEMSHLQPVAWLGSHFFVALTCELNLQVRCCMVIDHNFFFFPRRICYILCSPTLCTYFHVDVFSIPTYLICWTLKIGRNACFGRFSWIFLPSIVFS